MFLLCLTPICGSQDLTKEDPVTLIPKIPQLNWKSILGGNIFSKIFDFAGFTIIHQNKLKRNFAVFNC